MASCARACALRKPVQAKKEGFRVASSRNLSKNGDRLRKRNISQLLIQECAIHTSGVQPQSAESEECSGNDVDASLEDDLTGQLSAMDGEAGVPCSPQPRNKGLRDIPRISSVLAD